MKHQVKTNWPVKWQENLPQKNEPLEENILSVQKLENQATQAKPKQCRKPAIRRPKIKTNRPLPENKTKQPFIGILETDSANLPVENPKFEKTALMKN